MLAQSPASGVEALSNTPVTLTILAPGGSYPVPSVVGYGQAQAGATLATYGLSVGGQSTQCTSAPVANGNVSSTSPPAGTPVTAGTPVNLIISSGPCPVNVPDVYNLTTTQASQVITAAGLHPQIVTTCSQPGATPSNLIGSQYPTATTAVQPGSPVTAYVQCTPPSTTTTTVPGATGVQQSHGYAHHHHGRRHRD